MGSDMTGAPPSASPPPTSAGVVRTELRENAVGLPGMLMQGIATIAPSFAILASFVFIVSFAGVVTPWAYLFGGALLALQALNAAQLAEVFPSAGGWDTWIARAVHARAGFFAGGLSPSGCRRSVRLSCRSWARR